MDFSETRSVTESSTCPTSSPTSAMNSPTAFSTNSALPPSTPPRGRRESRYPTTLSRDPGRVPLHRRGTSRIYERMEDLLREAGYKETRVFTPETERTDGSKRREGGIGGVRGGVGAVVEFLAGWMPGTNKQEGSETSQDRNSVEEDIHQKSVPPSPLADRSRHSGPIARPRSAMAGSPRSSVRNSPERRQRSPMRQSLRLASQRSRPLRPQPSASESLRAYAVARGYLRHMASAPSMAHEENAAPRKMRSRLSHARGDDPEQTALPSNWFDSINKAVMGASDPGLRIGGPAFARPASRQSRPNGALVGPPNPTHPENLLWKGSAPPPSNRYLRTQLAPNAVTTAQVVCQSAPASRSSSRVGQRLAYGLDKGKNRDDRKFKGQKSDADEYIVPTLAATRLENDSWCVQWVDGRRVPVVVTESPSDDDGSDDDGELDLARLLVPPKRQNSIRSLRRHLHRSESARALRQKASAQLRAWDLDDDEGAGGRQRSLLSGSRRGSNNDDDDGSDWGVERGPRHRRRLPGPWSGTKQNNS